MLTQAAICRDGNIITGKRHYECIIKAREQSWTPPIQQSEQGFVDENGKYYSRKEALEYAKKIGQVSSDKNNVLLSEDLW